MNNNLYLIHEDDYIKHIDEKVFLYSLVKQLTHHVARLAPNRGSKKISNMAKCYDTAAEKMFRSWGIPVSYLVFDNKDDLATLMENELIEPEEAGYYACDGERCFEFCESYYPPTDDSKDEPDEDEDFEKMMSALTSVIHEHFGSNVTVHIVFD